MLTFFRSDFQVRGRYTDPYFEMQNPGERQRVELRGRIADSHDSSAALPCGQERRFGQNAAGNPRPGQGQRLVHSALGSKI